MSIIAIVLLVLVFLPIAILGIKTWHWLHVTACVFLFGATLWFTISAASVAALHLEYKAKYHKEVKKLAQAKEQISELANGPRGQAIPPEPGAVNTDSWNPDAPLSTCRTALARIIGDRGRVWRGCAITGGNQAAGQFQVTTALAEGVENHGIAVNDVLYAFAETGRFEGNENVLPQQYVGEFKVTEATNNAVMLNLTTPEGVDGSHTLLNTNISLSLYSLMPIDGHIFFATEPAPRNFGASVPVSESPVFGKMFTAEEFLNGKENVPAIFGVPAGYQAVNPSSPPLLQSFARQFSQAAGNIGQSIVNEYVRDGGPWREGDREANHWVRVKFLKPSPPMRVDSGAEQGVTDGFYFDPTNGQAAIPTLRGGTAEGQIELVQKDYQINDYALFPNNEQTQNLVAQQICEIESDVYVRQLNDYSFSFSHGFELRSSLSQSVQLVTEEIASLQRTQARTDRQITSRQTERDELTADKEKFDQEQQVAAEYLSTLNQQWTSLQTELSKLYQQNVALEGQLNEVNRQLTETLEANVR